jgi:hypothetical protein
MTDIGESKEKSITSGLRRTIDRYKENINLYKTNGAFYREIGVLNNRKRVLIDEDYLTAERQR